ncbi:MAG: mismatch repair protein [Pseudomonadota bacterium]
MTLREDPSAAGQQAPLTPMLQQYFDLKAKAEGAVLFFRMGDFYEIFGPDAEEIAPKMDVVLTSRERGDAERMPFCGVPYHSVKTYLLKLLRQGYKVAIAEQLEDPAKTKGLVERGIVKTLTPGCIDELEGMDSTSTNHVLAVFECPDTKRWSALVIELSTGELRLGQVKSSDLPRLVQVFRPREVWARAFQHDLLKGLIPAAQDDFTPLLEPLAEGPLRDHGLAARLLGECLGKAGLDSFPCGKIAGGDALVASAIQRLRNLNAATTQFRSVKPLFDPDHMILGPTAIRDLELFETALRRQQEGSLARTIDRTMTPMGARRLRELLARPLVDRERLVARLDVVEFLAALGDNRLAEFRAHFKRAGDLTRLATRVMGRVAHPAELAQIRQTLANARELSAAIHAMATVGKKAPLLAGLSGPLEKCDAVLKLLAGALAENPGSLGTGCGTFREGWDHELDRCNALAQGGESQVGQYEQQLRGETGIGSLKIKSHKTFGLVIEITRANAGKVPAGFTRRQTMVNCERFSTPELDRLSHDLVAAQDAAIAREGILYGELLEKIAGWRDEIYSCAEAIAEADVWQSFAWLAIKEKYCRPITAMRPSAGNTVAPAIRLLAARHPVVEHNVGRTRFVANDVEMLDGTRQLLITGPNMAGKSTIMRQTALCAILHQAGCFVPAAQAELPVFDRVFTRVGASDDLSRGLSTFMVEMTEVAEILRESTCDSLVILDEVGRGTSTSDGLAIAAAILEEITTRNTAWTLFATHYHELVPMAANLPGVRPVQTEVLQKGTKVTFTHRLIPGAAGSSYGIEVARLAGVPATVLTRAARLLQQPVGSEPTAALKTGSVGDPSTAEIAYHPVLARIEAARINRMTPLQALNLLAELQASLATAVPGGAEETQGSLFPV